MHAVKYAYKHQFTIKCNIMSNELTPYNFNCGKDLQKDLNFNACVVKGNFTWNNIKQLMVPHEYWKEKRIMESIPWQGCIKCWWMHGPRLMGGLPQPGGQKYCWKGWIDYTGRGIGNKKH